MRLLMDEHQMGWDQAWDITRKSLAYTNHTLLPEALEKWPLPLFASVLPRHLEIIYEINRRFLDEVRARIGNDNERIARLSLIDEHGEKYVRMANLATVGSHAVNGVAELHSELLKQTTLHDFYELYPERFFNVTNGVTPRMWLAVANPELSELITKSIGSGWLTDETELRKLEPLADDAMFRERWREVKLLRKEKLATLVQQRTGQVINPATHVRCAGEAAARVQAAIVEHPLRDHALQAHQERSQCSDHAAHRDFRGQGGSGIHHGQAHHQAHQLGCRNHRCRSRGARRVARGLLSRLQREERADHLSRG